MIAQVSGTVLQVGPTSAVIDVGGLGVLTLCSPNTVAGLRIGQHATLATALVVREDSLTLYGFASSDEREFFELLLTATGARVERVLRMGVVWQLFRSGPLPATMLDRLVRLIGEEPSVVGDADPTLLRQADAYAVHGVCALLLELAEERPLVIAVDDVHFVDESSLQVLLYLRRRMRSASGIRRRG